MYRALWTAHSSFCSTRMAPVHFPSAVDTLSPLRGSLEELVAKEAAAEPPEFVYRRIGVA